MNVLIFALPFQILLFFYYSINVLKISINYRYYFQIKMDHILETRITYQIYLAKSLFCFFLAHIVWLIIKEQKHALCKM